ncbi:MAG: geranylgeranyl reductase family protein [Candidatus Thorarchaeota archaeon]|nr:geranylgeranyl reductase family protein [Candidatus Thorarchaeota archaeon]
MAEYDVIVVGGGPAGATAARKSVQNGLNVLLLDKATFPRNKPCAGGLKDFVLELLDFDISSVIHRKISGVALFAPEGYRVDCIPEDRSKPGWTVMREDFDHLLLKKASEAGAVVKEGAEVMDVQESAREITVTCMDGNSYTSNYLVGADGINSIVAKQLGFYKGWRKDSASVAIEIEAEVGSEKVKEICGEPGGYDAELLLLYFGDFPHGYAWCFPKKTVLSVGACCRQDKVTNIRAGYDAWFERFKKAHDIEPKILSDSASRFPLRPAETIVKGRSLLIGDAAGLVDAFTGEGIPEAIESGIFAADAVKDAVRGDNPQTLKSYEKQCQKTIQSELKVSQSLANVFFKNAKNMDILCRFFRDDPYARYLIAASIGGLLSQKEIKKKMTFRMMKTMPKDALSLYM